MGNKNLIPVHHFLSLLLQYQKVEKVEQRQALKAQPNTQINKTIEYTSL